MGVSPDTTTTGETPILRFDSVCRFLRFAAVGRKKRETQKFRSSELLLLLCNHDTLSLRREGGGVVTLIDELNFHCPAIR